MPCRIATRQKRRSDSAVDLLYVRKIRLSLQQVTVQSMRLLPRILVTSLWTVILTCVCSAQTTDRVIVKQSSRNNKTTLVDAGPAIKDAFGGPDFAGMHGWLLGCNNEQTSCYMPHTGASGRIVDDVGGEDVYDGENVHIVWSSSGVRATYVLKETY